MVLLSLGPLEREIMECVWEHDEKTVRAVYDCLRSRRCIAYTTVMTLMARLVKKGFLSRKKAGVAYVYFPLKSKKQTVKSLAKQMVSFLVEQFGKESVAAFADELNTLLVGKN